MASFYSFKNNQYKNQSNMTADGDAMNAQISLLQTYRVDCYCVGCLLESTSQHEYSPLISAAELG